MLLEVAMTAQKKRVLPPSVQVYFETDKAKRLLAQVRKLSEKTGMSASKVVYLSVLYGLPKVAEQVTGLYLDAEVANDAERKTKRSYKV
jgi:hypothetical protein